MPLDIPLTLISLLRLLFNTMVELVASRRVAPRTAARRYPLGLHPVGTAAERACAAEATSPMTDATGTLIEELFGAHAASASRRRDGVVAARQPLPLNRHPHGNQRDVVILRCCSAIGRGHFQ